MNPRSCKLSIGDCARLACLLEASAPKVGNVHRGADFEDLSFNDFLASAVAIGPAMESAQRTGVGPAVLAAITATQELVDTNTNLGMVLLIAPLAAVPREDRLGGGIREVLRRLSARDAQATYAAIRMANPGGLGTVNEMDVREGSPSDLLQAMQQAAERDLVARQYTNGFNEVLELVVPWLVHGRETGWSLTETIVHAHIQLLAAFPDSLIARKCGMDVAKRATQLARHVLDAGSPRDSAYAQAAADLDFWLRSDGHRRNPGTSADLIAAGLFAALRESLLVPSFR